MNHADAVGVLPVGSETSARRTSPRSRGRVIAVIAVSAAVLLGTLLTVYMMRRPENVSVVGARTEDVTRMLAVTGHVEAASTVSVAPQFAGRITEILKHEGDAVRAGELLARLEDPSARSAVIQQRAQLATRIAELTQNQRDLARTSKLVATGAVAATELDAARLAVTQATNDVVRLRSVLEAGRAQFSLVAPFAGTVVRRDGELGAMVGPATSLFQISTVDIPRVTAQVDERYVQVLRPGLSAEILVLGESEPGQPATISYVARAVDPTTGAATVRFTYATPPANALVGRSVDINVRVSSLADAVTIPREALAGVGAMTSVLVVRDGRVERTPVVVEDWPAPTVVVTSGLREGDLVVLDPTRSVVGARVRAVVVPDGI